MIPSLFVSHPRLTQLHADDVQVYQHCLRRRCDRPGYELDPGRFCMSPNRLRLDTEIIYASISKMICVGLNSIQSQLIKPSPDCPLLAVG